MILPRHPSIPYSHAPIVPKTPDIPSTGILLSGRGFGTVTRSCGTSHRVRPLRLLFERFWAGSDEDLQSASILGEEAFKSFFARTLIPSWRRPRRMRGEHAAESGDLRTYAAEVPVGPRRGSHVDAAPFDRTSPELPIANITLDVRLMQSPPTGDVSVFPRKRGRALVVRIEPAASKQRIRITAAVSTLRASALTRDSREFLSSPGRSAVGSRKLRRPRPLSNGWL